MVGEAAAAAATAALAGHCDKTAEVVAAAAAVAAVVLLLSRAKQVVCPHQLVCGHACSEVGDVTEIQRVVVQQLSVEGLQLQQCLVAASLLAHAGGVLRLLDLNIRPLITMCALFAVTNISAVFKLEKTVSPGLEMTKLLSQNWPKEQACS